MKYKHIVRNCTCYSVPIAITHSQPRSYNSRELADAIVHQDHNLEKYTEKPSLVRWTKSLQPFKLEWTLRPYLVVMDIHCEVLLLCCVSMQ